MVSYSNSKVSRRSTLRGLAIGASAGTATLAGCSSNNQQVSTPVKELWMRIHEDDSATIALYMQSESDNLEDAIEKSDSISSYNSEFKVISGEAVNSDKLVSGYNYKSVAVSDLVEDSSRLYKAKKSKIELSKNTLTDNLIKESLNSLPLQKRLKFEGSTPCHVEFADGVRFVIPHDRLSSEGLQTEYPYEYSEDDEFIQPKTEPNASAALRPKLDSKRPLYPAKGSGGSHIPPISHYNTSGLLSPMRNLVHTKREVVNSVISTLNVDKLREGAMKDIKDGIRKTLAALPTPYAGKPGEVQPELTEEFLIESLGYASKVARRSTTAAFAVYDLYKNLNEAVGAFSSGLETLSKNVELSTERAFGQVAPFDDLTQSEPMWPTAVDLRELIIREYNQVASFISMPESASSAITYYLDVLKEQDRIISHVINYSPKYENSLSDVAAGVGSPTQVKIATFLVNALNNIQQINARQRDILKEYRKRLNSGAPTSTRSPTATATDTSTPTETETPTVVETATESLVIDGRNFSIRPNLTDSGPAGVKILHKSKGTRSYPTSSFQFEIEGSNADGTYELAEITSDTTFSPGNTYIANKKTLGLSSELEFVGSTITLFYKSKGKKVEVVRASFSKE